ncbi:myotubularin-related protein 9 isoform X2 [Lingula anatina]|uniref:Myotubularin-related protein 9 isoform X1 n=1 Tax=Lingula anatina TaxID=7574 RepID=A0A1S3IM21_LINAN|nr:myotubularin-related protein 9 isoform X1 [Lingula anatina]XP_013398952.1 myotubularin-related protein 9 isoform X2 [Lingula anatina]|eukprot:XP_013398951.1 myotubularin-related protein 9 isoform X1 [Lingula anatina]
MEFAEFIKVPKLDGVVLRLPFKEPVEGTLCITGHHLFLSSRKTMKEELWLEHSAVDAVEKKLSNQNGGTLTLKCKNFMIVELDVPTAEDCLQIAHSVESLSNIHNLSLKYPFFYRANFEMLEDGWTAFMPESEFNKVGSSDQWRISYVNNHFEVCPSYSYAVIVPKSIDDETIAKAASFRHHNRFPVLSYYHKENGRAIIRSSQPLVGPNMRRCKEDEQLLNATLNRGKGYIVDTRIQSSAKMAQAKGGGFEPEQHYHQWKRIHQPVERQKYFHEALIKFVEACMDFGSSTEKWLSRLESSGWLNNIKEVLTCACVVAQCVDKDDATVLVHGSEGMDTTLQVTALAQLILDHDCRTIRGFEALIEREWLQSGHPFADRCAKSAFAMTKQRNESPVFLLFLDCVWQIWQQFPCSFEFNEDFLLMLFEQAYSSQFGTFLCNNDCERKKYKLASKTVSLWSYVNRPEVLEKYINHLYQPNQSPIWPSVAPQSLEVWQGLYLRWKIDRSGHQDAWKEIFKVREKNKELKLKANRLRRQMVLLQKEAIEAELLQPCAPNIMEVEDEDTGLSAGDS